MKINITDHDTFGELLLMGEAYDEEAHVQLSGEYDHLISIVDSAAPGEEAGPPPCGWEFWELLPEEIKLRLVYDDLQEDNKFLMRSAPTEAHVREVIRFALTATDDTRMIVHCASGVSRSSAAALVYLCARGVSPRVAIDQCIAAKAAIVPNRNFVVMGDKLLGLNGELARARDHVWGTQKRC